MGSAALPFSFYLNVRLFLAGIEAGAGSLSLEFLIYFWVYITGEGFFFYKRYIPGLDGGFSASGIKFYKIAKY